MIELILILSSFIIKSSSYLEYSDYKDLLLAQVGTGKLLYGYQLYILLLEHMGYQNHMDWHKPYFYMLD